MRTSLLVMLLIGSAARADVPLRGISLSRDLSSLQKLPDGRDPSKRSFRASLRFARARMKAIGLHAGMGPRRYLQKFSWSSRFAPEQTTTSANVVGVLRGAGAQRGLVLVTAHIDGLSSAARNFFKYRDSGLPHYEGASDNASSVATLLHVAEKMARLAQKKGRAFRRDVVFVVTSAEEEGLVGSRHFAANPGPFQGRPVAAVLNIDTVGRGTPQQLALSFGHDVETTAKNPLLTELITVKTKGLPPVGLSTQIFRQSDHASFAERGHASVMLHGAIDDANSSRDTFAKLNHATVKAAARHAFRAVYQLAQSTSLVAQSDLPRFKAEK